MWNCNLRLFKMMRSLKISKRDYSTTNRMIIVSKNIKTGTSTIFMNRPPVNALNLEMLLELKESLENIEKDGASGVIFTSHLAKVFTGGIDLTEFYKPNVDRLIQYWMTYEEVMMKVYGLGLPTVAVINAASPAGGCILGLSCEYRVMVDGKHRIGLNETKLGLVAPPWVMALYINAIGYRRAELALMKAQQFTPQEALGIGLVDEVVHNKEDALIKAEEYIGFYSKISNEARAQTKGLLRKSLLEENMKNREELTESLRKFAMQPEVQEYLGKYLESLSDKNT